MSIKEDKKIYKNNQLMKVAINLANLNKGLTGTNPSVGCVIEKNDIILSYGVTSYNGRPHAEHIAINKLKSHDKKLPISYNFYLFIFNFLIFSSFCR